MLIGGHVLDRVDLLSSTLEQDIPLCFGYIPDNSRKA